MAECATAASCASSGGGSSVGTDLNGGELCALRAEEGREARERRVNAKEGERLSRSPYLFTAEEIVGARFAAHDLVTDGELRPHDLRHDLLCGLTAARSDT